MVALDTNVLVYAWHRSSPHHADARALLTEVAVGMEPWALPWPCVYEFLRITTHPNVFRPPMSAKVLWSELQDLLRAPSLVMLAETPRHPAVLSQVLEQSGARGNLVHDAHIWALCLEHGITELITADRDFHRFAGLRVRNPFLGSA